MEIIIHEVTDIREVFALSAGTLNRDASRGKIVGIIDSYESLMWTERAYEVGQFALKLGYSDKRWNLFKKGNLLTIKYGHTAMVVTARKKQDTPDGPMITVTGRCAKDFLDRNAAGAKVKHMERIQGTGQNILRADPYYHGNIAGFQPLNLSVEDAPNPVYDDDYLSAEEPTYVDPSTTLMGFLTNYSSSYRMPIYLQSDNDTEACIVVMGQPQDRSFEQNLGTAQGVEGSKISMVTFASDLESLSTLTVVDDDDGYYNRVISYVGNQTSYLQYVFDVPEETNMLNVRTTYQDNSDLASLFEDPAAHADILKPIMQARAGRTLANSRPRLDLDLTVPPNVYKYVDDYRLGDKVNVKDNQGNIYIGNVSEVIISDEGSGLEIYPQVLL